MLLMSPKKHVWSKKEKRGFTFRLNFITLTLSDVQVHTDTHIVTHMLQPFLKWMARSHNAWNYVWKAEAQDNGNLHFHITTNKFIHYDQIKKKWNSLQLAHGYMAKYNAGHSANQAPSTEIKAVKNEKELARYMGKYFSKNDVAAKKVCPHRWQGHIYDAHNDQYTCNLETGKTELIKRRVTCKLWSCNAALMATNLTINEYQPEYWDARRHWIETNVTETKKLDFAEVHFQSVTQATNCHTMIMHKLLPIFKAFNAKDDGIVNYKVETLSAN